tara:strand:+ start:449 stop:748 length:300 start_codon:yes stop_codon:yes gene_type:complete
MPEFFKYDSDSEPEIEPQEVLEVELEEEVEEVEEVEVAEEAIEQITSSIKKDFVTIKQLKIALRTAVAYNSLKEFASKYDVDYNEESEIIENAQNKYKS